MLEKNRIHSLLPALKLPFSLFRGSSRSKPQRGGGGEPGWHSPRSASPDIATEGSGSRHQAAAVGPAASCGTAATSPATRSCHPLLQSGVRSTMLSTPGLRSARDEGSGWARQTPTSLLPRVRSQLGARTRHVQRPSRQSRAALLARQTLSSPGLVQRSPRRPTPAVPAGDSSPTPCNPRGPSTAETTPRAEGLPLLPHTEMRRLSRSHALHPTLLPNAPGRDPGPGPRTGWVAHGTWQRVPHRAGCRIPFSAGCSPFRRGATRSWVHHHPT